MLSNLLLNKHFEEFMPYSVEFLYPLPRVSLIFVSKRQITDIVTILSIYVNLILVLGISQIMPIAFPRDKSIKFGIFKNLADINRIG